MKYKTHTSQKHISIIILRKKSGTCNIQDTTGFFFLNVADDYD